MYYVTRYPPLPHAACEAACLRTVELTDTEIMPAVRRKAGRRWPRAAAVVIGLAGGCLSAVPPVVPPGWSVHFHQDTPYVSNREAGTHVTTAAVPRAAVGDKAQQDNVFERRARSCVFCSKCLVY